MKELESIGAKVVAASVDDIDKAKEVADEVSFPVAHGVTRAFMAPMAATQTLAHDPWTGAPWLWTEGVGLWNGLTGARLDNQQTATQALQVIELSALNFPVSEKTVKVLETQIHCFIL